MHVPIMKLATLAVILALLAGCGAGSSASSTPTPAGPLAAERSGAIVADAVVLPNRSVDVTFEQSGTVAEILVHEGDTVQQGEPLARLDARNFELQVAQSKASLAQAQAAYDKIEAGSTAEAIAAQQAVVRTAEANLTKIQTGNASSADIISAQAQVRSAQARLSALKNPTADKISTTQLRVTQAQHDLDSIRTSTSANKTNAELSMRQATDNLTKAQAAYATAKVNWDYVRETGQDPTNPESRDSSGKTVKNKLNDVQERQYYETFVQAEASLANAEKAVVQAQVTFDKTRQDEIIQIQRAEAALADAQQQLNALLRPSATDITQAQASVDQAKANLQKVQQGGTEADISAAKAALEQQQANLEQLTVPARAVDLAEAQGRIDAARAALKQAELNLAQATVRAPFAGTIAERNLEVGQRVTSGGSGSSAAPFVLAEFGSWKIETSSLSELDVVRFQEGTPAQLTFDALPGVKLSGKVTAIKPRGTDRFGDMTYVVTVIPGNWDQRLRWNMSATVSIQPAS